MKLSGGCAPERIVDLLETNGGWWDEWAMAEALDTPRPTVHKAAYRLTEAGMLEKRQVGGKAHGFKKNEYAWRS